MNSLFAAGTQASTFSDAWLPVLVVVALVAAIATGVFLSRRRRSRLAAPSAKKRWLPGCPGGGGHQFRPVVEAGEHLSRCIKCNARNNLSFTRLGEG